MPLRKLSMVRSRTFCSEGGRDSIFFIRRIIFKLNLSFSELLVGLTPKSSSVLTSRAWAKRMTISGLNFSLSISYEDTKDWIIPIFLAISVWVYPLRLRSLAIRCPTVLLPVLRGGNFNFDFLGYDVIAQATGTSDPNYFVYDGHGSVRHLADNSGTIVESYNYDAYGKAHGFTPTNASTNLLYAGEWHDSTAQQYYLRTRWYNPTNGRFNRMDPFAGNNRDPQSLHKYLYVHCNPINNIDPTGEIGLLPEN